MLSLLPAGIGQLRRAPGRPGLCILELGGDPQEQILPAVGGDELNADLPRLRASGPIGELLASQSEAHAAENGFTELGRTHAALPDDLLNIHWDPVTCAAALGWPGATIQEMTLRTVLENEVLRLVPDPDGEPTRVLIDVDGPAFTETWLAAVEAAQ